MAVMAAALSAGAQTQTQTQTPEADTGAQTGGAQTGTTQTPAAQTPMQEQEMQEREAQPQAEAQGHPPEQGATGFAVAPVPPLLYSAKKVFISNAGADSGLFPHPFSGDPDRAYNEFYAAVRAMGKYDLVMDPELADVVFELQLNAPSGPQDPNKQNGASDPLPMLRLVIYDGKTHYILWALTESIDPANLQKTHDRNFDMALRTLAEDLQRLTTKPVGTANP
jgi:hypothetical protein